MTGRLGGEQREGRSALGREWKTKNLGSFRASGPGGVVSCPVLPIQADAARVSRKIVSPSRSRLPSRPDSR